MYIGASTMENSMAFPQKTKDRITISYSYPTPGHLFTIRKDTCTPVFIATLFIIAKKWKQPKCSLTEEWIKKMWYIYAVEYYSAIERKETMAFAATWVDLEIIMLN